MAQPSMPVKLSGELVEEARRSSKLFHRSLTSQIEHWAALGRALESQVPTDMIADLLAAPGGAMKITQVARPDQRREVMAIISEVLRSSSEKVEHPWLSELSKRGVPLYGTRAGEPGIFRRDPDGNEELVASETR